MPAAYVLKTTALNGTDEQTIPWSDLHLTFVLDDSGTCDFSIANNEETEVELAWLAEGQRIVNVYRDGGEDPFWAGRLWRTEVQDSDKISCFAEGWFSVLRRRYLEPPDSVTFGSPTGVWDVAWALITYAQDIYDEGLTRLDAGDGGKSIQPEFWWYDFSSIADHLQWLASQPWGAWDFYITPTKGWKTLQRHVHNTDIAFTQGDVVEKVSYTRSAEETATQMLIVGIGSGADTKYGEDTNAGAEVDFGHLTGTLDRRNTKIQSYLDDAATRQAEIRAVTQTQPSVYVNADAIDFDDLRLGENYQITYADRLIQLDDEYRLVSIDIEIQGSGREQTQCFFDAKWDLVDGPIGESVTPATFVASTNFETDSTVSTFDLARPAGLMDGDLLVVITAMETSGFSLTPPAGWTHVETADNFEGQHWAIDFKVAASEPDPLGTWTASDADIYLAVCLAYRGATEPTLVTDEDANDATDSVVVTVPTRSNAVEGLTLVSAWFATALTSTVPTWMLDAGLTSRDGGSRNDAVFPMRLDVADSESPNGEFPALVSTADDTGAASITGSGIRFALGPP